MKAHQRLIREREAAAKPRETVHLEGCTVRRMTRNEALAIIIKYEWLGTMPRGIIASYGLVSPAGDALGVACFGGGSGTLASHVCGAEWQSRTIVLERGACVHFAHPHAGSFLTAAAVKMCAKDTGSRVFLAYSDPAAGEIGTIYQACNWLYLGDGNGRQSDHRWEGRRIGTEKWMSSRVIRAIAAREGVDGPTWWAQARAGDEWEFRKSFNRARYITFVGSRQERRDARAALRYEPLPYPKRPA